MIAACAAVVPQLVAAQVEKRVEVTKAYVPRVESALKLAVEPDMTDTTRMRPEIDYTVTPLSLQTTLATRPIRPATVTYWEFNRPLPFYLKVGAGYPLNSVLDFYASTQNPSTGYVIGYLNHEGRYAKIANEIGVKNNSTRMYNRAGVAAGKYLGRHVLEGELSYDNRMYHRYGSYTTDPNLPEEQLRELGIGGMNDYGDAALSVRFGNDFQDLSRVNFEVGLHGDLFFDHSDLPGDGERSRQLNLGAEGRIARSFGRSSFSLGIGYDAFGGQQWLSGCWQQLIRASLRYRFAGGVVGLEAGADYYHDRVETPGEPEALVETGDYFTLLRGRRRGQPQRFPHTDRRESLRGARDVAGQEFGGLQLPGGSGRLAVAQPIHLPGLCRILGAGQPPLLGDTPRTLGGGRRIRNLRLDLHLASTFIPQLGRQTVTSFNGEIEYRPISSLRFDLGVHGRFYNKECDWANGEASFVGNIGVDYTGRKISFGIEARMESERSWSTLDYMFVDEARYLPVFKAPFTVDLRAHFDWRVSHRVTLFAEGRNLADRRLYDFARYPELGANFTVGVKANF